MRGPRCDERALAALFEFHIRGKSERYQGQAAQEPALWPHSDARRRRRGLACAVALCATAAPRGGVMANVSNHSDSAGRWLRAAAPGRFGHRQPLRDDVYAFLLHCGGGRGGRTL